MRRTVIALVVIAALAGTGRAEDPPPATRAVAPPAWKESVFGDLSVSRDGAWLGGCSATGWRLYPAAGGEPVALDVPADGVPSFVGGFTADSKWFVVVGQVASGATAKSRTQTVYVFPVAAPAKPKVLAVPLKSQIAGAKIPDAFSQIGRIVAVVPFVGSRVLFSFGAAGSDLWDVATPARLAAPPSLDGIRNFGVSDDGATLVRATDNALEVRDVASNRVTRTIAMPVIPKLLFMVDDVRLAASGADVVATFAWDDYSGGRIDVGEKQLECWSVADGRKRWIVSLGKSKLVSLDVSGTWAVVVTDERLRLFDLRDGSLAAHRLQMTKCRCAKPSADGKALWVVDDGGISRVELPAPK